MSNDALPYAKPLPVLEGLSGEFYAWCRQGELRFQRCTDCGTFRHVPRELCAQCNSFAWEWARSSGRGTVYTWTVVQRALARLEEKAQLTAAEAELRLSQEQYQTLFSTLIEGFCIIEVIFDARDRPVDYRFLEVVLSLMFSN